ncbi:TniB family NTP-binding protein [Salipiger sp. CCB-MM3]|uniref:TniB family NTP-binding protein n=1 Tax=Salipiger sp. CCB-MM3 TaxID=1792508 RepID=UPI00187D8E9A|nr:TniB family NTP-binding protein [Salipiger sp. CCB-MM3]
MTTQTGETAPTTISQKTKWLKDRYWRFGMEEVIDDHLFDLFEIDDDGEMTAQPRIDPLTGESRGLMVIGRSGDGKTALLKRTLRTSSVLTEMTDQQEGNTLYITVRPDATIKKLAEVILAATGYQRVDAKLRSADAWEMVMHRLSLVGVQLVVIDECHHLFRPGAGRDKLGAIQSMKHLLQSAGGLSIIIAGVADLREAILSETSGETYRRLQELDLDDIRPGSRETKVFATNFRKSAEILGIEVSEGDAFVERILFARNGQIGRSVALAKAILHDAVTRRRTMLSLERAEAVYRKNRQGSDMTPFHAAEWGTVKRELEAIGWKA